jgi:SulP family sulfate permease
LLVNLQPAAEKTLRSSQFISDDISIVNELDHALVWCENQVITRHRGLEQEESSLREWFVKILRTADEAEELMRRCQRVECAAGEIVVNAGDAADTMHFILDGRVGIMVPTAEGRNTRVRSLGRYTTIGEMGW